MRDPISSACFNSLGSGGFDYDILIEEVENPTGTNPSFQPQINAYTDVQS